MRTTLWLAGLALDEIGGDQIAAHLQFLAELGWRIANSSEMPAYPPGEQFARPRLHSTN